MTSTRSCWGGDEPDGLDPWLGDLKHVCEESEVMIHSKKNSLCVDGSSWGMHPCSSCRPRPVELVSLDSAPVIPEEEDLEEE